MPQPGSIRLVAEPVAGQRGAHEVERVVGIAAVRGGIRERADHLQELDDRPGPAVGDDQGQGIRVRRPGVEEVDAEPVDRGPELRHGVQPPLGRPPVVPLRPVAAELLQVGERDALGPVVDGLGLRPARSPQALSKLPKLGLRDVDGEGRQLIAHEAQPLRASIARSASAGSRYSVARHSFSSLNSHTFATRWAKGRWLPLPRM